MKNNLDTPVAKQCRALYTKYRIRTYVRPIKSWPLQVTTINVVTSTTQNFFI